MIGRQDVVAGDIFDDFVTLVHRLLDQRVTAQRADDVHARDIRFILRGKLGKCRRVVAGKFDSAGLDEAAWRYRAESRDYPVAFDTRLRRFCLQYDRSSRCTVGSSNFGDVRAVEALDSAVIDRPGYQRQVAVLGTGKFVAAVNDDDVVVLGERNRIFDGRVAGADDNNRFLIVFVGVIERVLNDARILALDPKFAWIALQADRQDHRFGFDLFAILQRQMERTVGLPDFRNFALVANVDAEIGKTLFPFA
ncbi:hypothetical protein MnTg04_01431 [bacterium MnTg04]|nr:hypothetical protein MnTg04_01431 [bacterium MnTg04]